MLWLDAGAHDLAPLDAVTCAITEGMCRGTVFVTPECMLQKPARVHGTIVAVAESPHPDRDCLNLPGADLPPLGSFWSAERVSGVVVRIDPVNRKATVRQGDEVEVVVSVAATVSVDTPAI